MVLSRAYIQLFWATLYISTIYSVNTKKVTTESADANGVLKKSFTWSFVEFMRYFMITRYVLLLLLQLVNNANTGYP